MSETQPPSKPSPPAMVLVSEHSWSDAQTLLMLDKLMRSASIKRTEYLLADLGGGRGSLWAVLKRENPHVVIPMGKAPARLLLRGNSSFRLKDVLNQPQEVAYLREGARVVPTYHPDQLLRKSKVDIRDAVQTLIRCRNYNGRSQDGCGTEGPLG